MPDIRQRVIVEVSGDGQLKVLSDGMEKVSKSTKKAQGDLSSLGQQLKAGLGIGAGMISIQGAIQGLKLLGTTMKESAEWAEKLGKSVRQTGIGAESLQKMEASAKALGYTMEDITSAAGKMQRGVSENSKAFRDLGLSVGNLRGMSPEKMFQTVAQAITSIQDPTRQAAAAMDVFGRSGAEIIPLLDEIADGSYRTQEAISAANVKILQETDRLIDSLDAKWERMKKNAAANTAVVARQMATGENFNDAKHVLSVGRGSFAEVEAEIARNSRVDGSSLEESIGLKAIDVAKVRAQETAKAEQDAAKAAKERAHWNARISDLMIEQIAGLFTIEDALKGAPGATKGGSAAGMIKSFEGTSLYSNASDAMRIADSKRETIAVTEATFQWQGALQGVALLAGAIGGSLGATLQVMGNLGESFKGWNAKNPDGTPVMSGTDKFNAIAGGVGQIGGLVGGRTGGFMSGAAGGAMAGMAIGGPIGAVAGGVIGGIAGIFGANKKKKEEEAQLKKAFDDMTDAIRKQFGSLGDAVTMADKYGVSLKRALDSKNADQLKKALEEIETRMRGVSMMADGINKTIENLDAAGLSPDALAAVAGQFSTSFGAVFRTQGLAGIDKLRGSFGTLLEQLEKAGLDPTALGLGRTGDLLEKTNDPKVRALLGVSEGQSSLLRGSLDAGYVDQRAIEEGNTIAKEQLDQLRAQGINAQDAANMMGDQLSALAQSYAATGQAMPEWLANALEEGGISVLPTTNDILRQIERNTAQPDQVVYNNSTNYRYDRGGDNWDGSSGDMPYGRSVGLRPKRLTKDTVFSAHQGELVMIVPKHLVSQTGFRSAARGYGEGEEPYEGRGYDVGSGTYGGNYDSDPVVVTGSTSSGPTTSASSSDVQAAVTQALAQATAVNVNNAPSITIVDQSAVKTAEGQRAFGQYVVAEVERALDQNSRGLRTRIESIARQAAR